MVNKTTYDTLFALQHFSDQTEFERLTLDILNKSGSGIAVPMANRGGGDGGQDIVYTNPSGDKSCVFVSLDKNGLSKFKKDAEKHKKGKYREYSYFTTAYITYDSKKKITSIALNDLRAIVHIYDIEVLRSLLDVQYADLKEKYLGISAEEKSDFKVQKASIKKYSAVVLEKYAKDLFDNTKKKFLAKSNIANAFPTSIMTLGVRSTEEILQGIQHYIDEVQIFKSNLDELYSFNLYYTSNLYDENVNVQITAKEDVTFQFGRRLLDQPAHPDLSDRQNFMTRMVDAIPSIDSNPYVPDKNEFLTNIENDGKLISSTIANINANQKKYLFDEQVFFTNKNGYRSISLIVEVFSKHSSNKKHEVVIELSDAQFVEIEPSEN